MIAPLFSKTCTQAVLPAQLGRLLSPHVDHVADVFDRHFRQGQVVARGETDHPAGALLALGAHQRMAVNGCSRRIGQQRGEIVGKDKGAGVARVALAAGALVARTEVAGRIVRRAGLLRRPLDLPLPGPLGPVR